MLRGDERLKSAGCKDLKDREGCRLETPSTEDLAADLRRFPR